VILPVARYSGASGKTFHQDDNTIGSDAAEVQWIFRSNPKLAAQPAAYPPKPANSSGGRLIF